MSLTAKHLYDAKISDKNSRVDPEKMLVRALMLTQLFFLTFSILSPEMWLKDSR